VNAVRWHALSSHLDHALDLPRADRDGWVAALAIAVLGLRAVYAVVAA